MRPWTIALRKFIGSTELGMVVDTTVHNSNKRATFHNYLACNDLQGFVPVALPPNWA